MVLLSVLLGASAVNAQTTYYSRLNATNFGDPASWTTAAGGVGGASPSSITSADNYIVQNNAVMTLTSGTVSVRNLTITTGSLSVNGGTLNISLPTGNTAVLTVNSPATFNINGGTVNLNGGMVLNSGGFFNQSGGNFNVDPNNGGDANTSYAGSVFNWNVASLGSISLSGGTLTVVDPSAATAATLILSFSGTTTGQIAASSNHTWRFGDGVSSDAGGSAVGFSFDTWVSTTGFKFGTVIFNGPGSGTAVSTNRIVSIGNSTYRPFLTAGNITINSGADVRSAGTASTNQFTTAGNLTVNSGGSLFTAGTVTFGDGNFTSSIAITAVPSNNAQTISGGGVFKNAAADASSTANFTAITINNTNPSGVTFNNANTLLCQQGSVFNTATVSGAVTFTIGQVNLNSNNFIIGVSTSSAGSLSWTAGGFNGGSVKRWFSSSTISSQVFPFLVNANQRNLVLSSSAALSLGGSVTVSHTDAAGLTSASITDGSYNVNLRSNAYWTVATGDGINPGTSTFNLGLRGDGIIVTNAAPGSTFPRLVTASSTVGAFANGTGTAASPQANRTGLSSSNLNANNFYIGLNTADQNQFYTVASGNWQDPSIWSGGSVPASTNDAIISGGTTVTVNSTAGVANTLLVNGTLNVTGSSLTLSAPTTGTGLTIGTFGAVSISSGTVNVGPYSNSSGTRFSSVVINGTYSMSGGTMNIAGNLNVISSAVFTQTSGTINVDGNALGVVANSVPAATSIVDFKTAVFTLTGGTLRIIDPHASTTAALTSAAFRGGIGAIKNVGSGHTIQFGDGTSTDAGGSSNGFLLIPNTSSAMPLGNISVVGSSTGNNRHVLTSGVVGILGNLTVSGQNGDFRLGSTFYVRGNITINELNAFTPQTNGVVLADYTDGITTNPSTLAQTVGGDGTFRNSTTSSSSTGSFAALTIINSNSTGVTFSGGAVNSGSKSFGGSSVPALSRTVTGTLTITRGWITVSGGTFLHGSASNTTASLSRTAGGFTSGSSVGRFLAGTDAGTTIAASTQPTTTGTLGSGTIPFVAPDRTDRVFYLGRATTTGATGGSIVVTYTENNTTNTISTVTDGSYSIDRQNGTSWALSFTNSFNPGSSETMNIAVNGTNLVTIPTTNTRLMQASSVAGSHQIGTIIPALIAQRTGVPGASAAGTYYLGFSASEIPIVSQASGDWSSTSTWQGGVVPNCNNVTIQNGHTVTVSSGTANAVNLTINTGGALTLSGGVTTVGCSFNNSTLANSGTLTLSNAASLIVNGNLVNNNSSIFTQGGTSTITIDGNAAGNTANSVTSGTPLLAFGTSVVPFSSGLIALNGGSITIVDPHAATASTPALYANISGTTTNFNSAATHTINFGDGSSTDAGGNTNGFVISTNNNTGRLNLGSIGANNPSGTNRTVILSNSTFLRGGLSVNAGSFSQNSNALTVGGDISVGNTGVFVTNTTLNMALISDQTAAAQTIAQSISVTGGGSIQNAATSPTGNFSSLNLNNTSSTGVTIGTLNNLSGNASFVGANLTGTLTLNGNASTPSGSAFLLGTSSATATLSYTAGGFTSGSSFAIGLASATAGATITANTLPTSTTGRFPFVSNANNALSRTVWIQRNTPSGAGIIQIGYNEAGNGTSSASVTDGTYNIDTRYNGNWTVSTLGTPNATTYTLSISAEGAFGSNPPINSSVRIMNASSLISGTSHQAGTTLPNAQRTGLTSIAGTFYVGINGNDVPFSTVSSGNFENGSIWNKGVAPSSGATVFINSGHTVTVSSTDANMQTLNVTSGGTLTVNGSNVNVGGSVSNSGTINANNGAINITSISTFGFTNSTAGSILNIAGGMVNVGPTDNTECNRTFTNAGGTLNITSGTLFVAGNVSITSGTFNMSGGSFTVDGNNGASSVGSVAAGTRIFVIDGSVNGTVNGGTITLVDPHYDLATVSTFGFTGTSTRNWLGNTLQLGDGVSSDVSSSTKGIELECFASGSGILYLGNVVVNSGSATNRFGATSNSTTGATCMQNLTINSGSEFRNTAATFWTIHGNILNNGILTTPNIVRFGFPNGSAITNAQSIGGTGIFRNSTTTSTGSFVNVLVNNNITGGGITLNVPISITGTLTYTNGVINTTSTNLLTLGSATQAGTLTAGSSTSYINGPFARTFASSRTATGTYDLTTLFPIGKGSTYSPVFVDPITSSSGAVTIVAESFTTNSGTPDAGQGVNTVAGNRWSIAPTSGTSANLTSTYFRVSTSGIVSTDQLLMSSSASGVYGPITGVSTSFASGAVNSLSTATPVASASLLSNISYGNLTTCTAPTAQAGSITASNLSTTSFTGSFTAASPAPSGYLVVRYPSGVTPTNPSNFTNYIVGSALGDGTIVSNGTSTTFIETTLLAGTTFDYYIYSYNNTACYGPAYLLTSPSMTSITTCATSIGVPGSVTTSNLGINGFTATWTASSTSGVSYLVDVSTNSSFSSFVPGYNGLNVGTSLTTNIAGLSPLTTYFVRVKATNGTCQSLTTTAVSVTTLCPATSSFPWTENFESLTTFGSAAANLPSCWTSASTQWTSSNATTYNDPKSGSNYIRCAWSTTNGFMWTPGFQLSAGVSYDLSMWIQGDGYTSWNVDFFQNTTASATGATQLPGGTYTPTGPGSQVKQSYVRVVRSFTPTTSGIYYFGIRVNESTGTPWYLAFDDFKFEPTPCNSVSAPPTVNSTTLNANQATLTWGITGTSTGNVYVEYGLASNFISAGTGTSQGSNSLGLISLASGTSTNTISGLSPNTTYRAFVRQACDNTGATFGSTSDAVTFTTPSCASLTSAPGVSTPDHQSALISWSMNSNTVATGNIFVEYGLSSNFTVPGTGSSQGTNSIGIVQVAAGQTSASISGLNPSTTYRVFVRQACDNSNTTFGTTSSGVTFTTPALVPRTLGTATAVQQTSSSANFNSTDVPILRIAIPVVGSVGTVILNSMTVNFTGSSAGIVAANGLKLWRSSSTSFAAATLVGSGMSLTSGAATFTSLNQSLTNATEYFWVTASLQYSSTLPATLDAAVYAGGIGLTGNSTAVPTSYPATDLDPSGVTATINYCTSNATNTADDDIGNFSITSGTTTILNNGTGTPALNNSSSVNTYTDFTSLGAVNLQRKVSYNFAVTQINSASFFACQTAVYIDYNQSGTFDAGEMVYNSTSPTTSSNNILSGIATIPNTAALGITRMRVVLTETSTALTIANACGTYTYGETEDYLVNIQAAPVCNSVPVAGSVSGASSLILTQSSDYSLTGSSNATGYQWQTSTTNLAGSWTNISGATTATYTLTANAIGTSYLRAYVIGGPGCDADTTSARTVTITAVPELAYSVVRNTGISYSSIISGGNNFSWPTSPSTDDQMSNALDITSLGFVYQGIPVTSMRVNTNGFLTFLASNTSTYTNSMTSTSALAQLSPYWDDLVAGNNSGGLTQLNNSIKYLITGTAPNQVMTIEWADMGRFSNTNLNFNFQVKLYQGTNRIEFIYGSIVPYDGVGDFTATYSMGITSRVTTSSNYYISQTVENTNNFSAGSTSGSTANNGMAVPPTCNSKYIFIPQGSMGLPTDAAVVATNDEPNTADVLSPPTGSYFDNCDVKVVRGATASTGIPTCSTASFTVNNDVWYTFTTGSSAAQYSINVTPNGGYDVAIQLLRGSASSLINDDCVNDGSTGIKESLTKTLLANTTYFVRVISNNVPSGTVGAFGISVFRVATPPSNDNCSGAVTLTVNASSTWSGNTADATASTSVPSCAIGNANDDVWYKFTPSGTFTTITVTGRTGYNAVLQVLTGTCGSQTSVTCVNSTGINGSESYSFTTTPGTTYFVRVYDFSASTPSTGFDIQVTAPVPSCPSLTTPSNGSSSVDPSTTVTFTWGSVTAGTVTYNLQVSSDPTFATINYTETGLTGTTTTVAANTFAQSTLYYWRVLAVNSNGTSTGCTANTFSTLGSRPSCATGYTPSNASTNISLTPTLSWTAGGGSPDGYDVYFDVTASNVNNLVSGSLLSSNQSATSLAISTALSNNATYYWKVVPKKTGSLDASGCPTLSFTTVPAAPTNDECSGARTVVVNDNPLTAQTSAYATQSQSPCTGAQANDVWYSFVADGPRQNISVVGSGGLNAIVQLFSGSCGSLTSLYCVNNTGNNGSESINATGLTVGNTYFIRVYNANSGFSVGTSFTIEVTNRISWNGTSWVGGTPGSGTGTTQININSGTATVSNGAAFGDLNIGSGATLNVPAGVTVTINGDIACYGSITGLGTIIIGSGGTQNLRGTMSFGGVIGVGTGTTFNVTSNGMNRLTILDGGSLLHGTGTSFNGTSMDGTVSGNVNIRRTGSTSPLRFNFWSSPVVGATVASLGSSGTGNTKRFDASTQSYVNAANTDVMNAGVGYTAVGSSSGVGVSGGREFVGVANNGTINVGMNVTTVNGSDSWNLIGNPYPSQVDGASFLSANTSTVNGTVYLWNSTFQSGVSGSQFTSADYVTRNAASANFRLGVAQGFFVQALGTQGTSVNATFTNSMRTGNTSTFFRTRPIERVYVGLYNSQNEYQENLIAFTDDATDGYDQLYDAIKLKGNSYISLYSKLNGGDYAIQTLGELNTTKVVSLGLLANRTGQHTFTLQGMDNVDANTMIYLYDSQTGMMHNLRNGNYSFNVTTTGVIDNRFSIHFQPMATGVGNVKEARPTIFVSGSTLKITGLTNDVKVESIEVVDMSGRRVMQELNVNVSNMVQRELTLPVGAYLVKVKTTAGEYVEKVIKAEER